MRGVGWNLSAHNVLPSIKIIRAQNRASQRLIDQSRVDPIREMWSAVLSHFFHVKSVYGEQTLHGTLENDF